ncbi:MAG: pilus assembly protein PilM [Planctomycetota bacterium]|nr:pilus assembly protein PilM [Planctomycetota bacterium]
MVRSIGIDSGDRAVHVVNLDGSYRKTRLVSRHSAPVGANDDPMRPDIVADAVREALDGGMKGAMTLGHPCREAVLRTIELPFKGADAIKKVVKSEIEGEIYSHSVEDTVVDFHEIGEGATGGTRVLIASVPKIGLRNQLNSLDAQGIDPETVDLDTMALWRAADWAGVFEGAGEEGDGAAAPVHVVVDLGARAVRVLLAEGEQLVDMRTLRLGDHVVADQIARAPGIHGEQAREAIAECLQTGGDSRVEQVDPPALAAPEDGAEGEAPAAPEPARAEIIAFDEVDAAHTKYLKRLARELTRFLTATGMAPRIRSVWLSGSGCRAAGVHEMLAAVFGCEPKELDVLSHLAHDLDEAEAAELSPQLAVAVGLALSSLGGPEGFQLRQEDLAQTGGFDAIKFPLAIACMVGLLAMFVFAQVKSMELTKLEHEIGEQPNVEQAAFHGYLNPIFGDKWLEDKRYFALKGKDGRTTYKYKDLVADVSAAEVHERVGIVRRKLRDVARQKQKETGVYEDVKIESGLSVLVRWAEMIKSIEPQLGRYLVPSIKLGMKPGSRRLVFTVAFRGEDFRSRMGLLQNAINAEASKADSPFLPTADPTPKDDLFADRDETGVTGAYYTFTLPIKEIFEPFGPSARVGALDAVRREQDYLAAVVRRAEVVR